MRTSKNSRVGRVKDESNKDCLPKYNPGNCGATWKTGACSGGSRKLEFRIKRDGRYI